MMNQRRTFIKQVGAVFAGVAAAVYCPAVLAETFETDSARACRLIEEFNRRKGEFARGIAERLEACAWDQSVKMDDDTFGLSYWMIK